MSNLFLDRVTVPVIRDDIEPDFRDTVVMFMASTDDTSESPGYGPTPEAATIAYMNNNPYSYQMTAGGS